MQGFRTEPDFQDLFKLGQVPPNTRPSFATWTSVFKNGQLLLALMVILLQFAAQFTAFTYSASLLAKVTHLSSKGISMTLLLFGAASIVGNSIGGILTDCWGSDRVLLTSLLLLGIDFFALSMEVSSIIGAAIAFVVWGFTGMAFTPAQQARLIGLAPVLTSVLLSLNASFMYLGTAVGSVLGGFVVNHLSVTTIGTVAGLLLTASLLFFLLSQRRAISPATSTVEKRL